MRHLLDQFLMETNRNECLSHAELFQLTLWWRGGWQREGYGILKKQLAEAWRFFSLFPRMLQSKGKKMGGGRRRNHLLPGTLKV